MFNQKILYIFNDKLCFKLVQVIAGNFEQAQQLLRSPSPQYKMWRDELEVLADHMGWGQGYVMEKDAEPQILVAIGRDSEATLNNGSNQ